MTAQRILVASLDYKQILEHSGVRLSEQTIRALNGQTEFLCAMAQLETNQCDLPGCDSGAPYHSELVADSKGASDE